MKTLVIQLARLGDIYQTWPVLKALKRFNPDEQVDLVVRERFSGAAVCTNYVDKLHVMKSADILQPILDDVLLGVAESQSEMDAFLQEMKEQGYDKIVNLSFSPLSSYITHFLSEQTTQVSGYTRHTDGYFLIPDDTSAYFYAQVGVGRFNRAHLTDIFAAIAGVDLEFSDFDFSQEGLSEQPSSVDLSGGDPPIVIHIGASQESKRLSGRLWREVISRLRMTSDKEVILVGSLAEQGIASEVLEGAEIPGLRNMVGATSLSELWGLIEAAEILVGCDSAPMQIASLTGTRCLNLSFPSVNFWETGPRARASRVILFESIDQVGPRRVASEVQAMIDGEESGLPIIHRNPDNLIGYTPCDYEIDDFQWRLIEAIYMEGDFPPSPDKIFTLGCQRLAEVCLVALEQIDTLLLRHDAPVSVEILDQVDEIIRQVVLFSPRLDPIVQWFQTERTRIPPANMEETAKATKDLFEKLFLLANVYVEEKLELRGVNANDEAIK